MSSQQNTLTKTYVELSSLYKNPTRSFRGMAASNQDTRLDTELVERHKRLLSLFKKELNHEKWDEKARKPALYFKVLSLLYEVDDYRGVSPSVKDLILREHSVLIRQFDLSSKRRDSVAHRKGDFKDREERSLWKAKALCCVAAIESRRGNDQSNVLLGELNIIEEFIKKKLHQPEGNLPAWTTLAFVCAAQARIARQSEMYSYMRDRLQSVVQFLDERSEQIIERLAVLKPQKKHAKETEDEIEKLSNDLIFIRRKQTLSTSFNVGLAELQRGTLRFAAYACQAAQLEFRLHGQLFNRLFNELLMLSVKRGLVSRDDKDEFRKLKEELERDILPLLKPEGHAGNPKLYLYGLREKAVIQYRGGEYDEMLKTLDEMEERVSSSPQWTSRINNQRARAHWRRWAEGETVQGQLQTALDFSADAFHHASGLDKKIETYPDTKSLLVEIEGSSSNMLIDTLESLITYGDVQIGLRNFFEATKSAAAVIRLCKENNPRLSAMGHLVMAEAYSESGHSAEANQHLASAKILEKQIDHQYVADRIRAVEKLKSMKFLDLSSCTEGRYYDAERLLIVWCIEHWSNMNSVLNTANAIGISRTKLEGFLNGLTKDSPHHYLRRKLKDKPQRKRRKRHPKADNDDQV